MALENEVQVDTIPELNEEWPLGTDKYSEGDNHIRLIKKVLKYTFPNLNAPITLTPAQINRGSIPISSTTVFYQATAPTGWIRVTGITSSAMIRIVPTGTTGGASGGTDDPVINSKVPSHIHPMDFDSKSAGSHNHNVNGDTRGENQDHRHYINSVTGITGNHQHYINLNTNTNSVVNNQGNIPAGGAGGNAAVNGPNDNHSHNVSGNSEWAGNHNHVIQVWSDSNSREHVHAFNVTSGDSTTHVHDIIGNTQPNNNFSDWRPRYFDLIMCTRQS